MKREIIFRGKRLDNGEWVEGTPVWSVNDRCYMIIGAEESEQLNFLCQIEYVEVEPETVGQWTGLKDKNGQDIYEGDILLRQCYNIHSDKEEFVEYRSQVYFSATTNPCGWRIKNSTPTGGWSAPLSRVKLYNNKAVVIGNIHDNPELLEEE